MYALFRKALNSEDTSIQHYPNTFERVTQHLEALPLESTSLNFEQVVLITEPIVRHSSNDDLMNLAKSYSKHLYAEVPPNRRVTKINELVCFLFNSIKTRNGSYLRHAEALLALHLHSPTDLS